MPTIHPTTRTRTRDAAEDEGGVHIHLHGAPAQSNANPPPGRTGGNPIKSPTTRKPRSCPAVDLGHIW